MAAAASESPQKRTAEQAALEARELEISAKVRKFCPPSVVRIGCLHALLRARMADVENLLASAGDMFIGLRVTTSEDAPYFGVSECGPAAVIEEALVRFDRLINDYQEMLTAPDAPAMRDAIIDYRMGVQIADPKFWKSPRAELARARLAGVSDGRESGAYHNSSPVKEQVFEPWAPKQLRDLANQASAAPQAELASSAAPDDEEEEEEDVPTELEDNGLDEGLQAALDEVTIEEGAVAGHSVLH
jgi:hypothetical protein